MNGLVAALVAEWCKVRRSKLPLATFGAFTGAAGIGALFMVVLGDPDRVAQAGALGQKAALTNLSADWGGMLGFLEQVVAVGGLPVFAFVATWMFGREYTDDTLRYLLILPISSTMIVVAKLVVTVLWCLLLTVWLLGLGVVLGLALGLPGWEADLVAGRMAHAGLAAMLMLAVVAPVPVVACMGRGYLAPLGAALAAVVVAQVAAALGAGTIVPWSIPAVATGLVPGAQLTVASWLVAAATAIGGVTAVIRWWSGPDAGR